MSGARRPLRIAVSACLLGEEVRWDGGHKRDRFAADVLARSVTLVPVCPEVEVGMGVPREPIRLERRGRGVRLVAPGSGADHTLRMRRWAEAKVRELERLGVAGFVLKADSPSCGLERVRVWKGDVAAREGRGAFAAVLAERLPDLPVVEEAALHDRASRDAFLARAAAYDRARGPWGPAARRRQRRSRP